MAVKPKWNQDTGVKNPFTDYFGIGLKRGLYRIYIRQGLVNYMEHCLKHQQLDMVRQDLEQWDCEDTFQMENSWANRQKDLVRIQ